MKEKIREILNRIESGNLTFHDAETELLDLFAVIPRSIPDDLYLQIAREKLEKYPLFSNIEKEGAYSDGSCDTIDIIEEWLKSL